MFQIDREAFGAFVAALRKERGMTQKDLAEKLYLSDKAVSKWERGLSMPDVVLLQPLSELLGVTVTELLRGERMERATGLSTDEADELVAATVELSAREQVVHSAANRRWRLAYFLCAAVGLAEVALLLGLGFSMGDFGSDVILVEGLSLLFGAWLCFFAPDTLPVYYDQNRINFFSDGIFRINVPGIRFNNSNWRPIRQALLGWLLGAAALFPLLWLGGGWVLPEWLWPWLRLPLTLAACLGMFIPLYVVGRKYE